MFYSRFFILVVAILLIGSMSASAEETSGGVPFGWEKRGERLHYLVHWGWVKAGEAEIFFDPVEDPVLDTYSITARAWTTPGISSVFRLRDRIRAEGIHAPMPFAVQRFDLDLNENDYKAVKHVAFDRGNMQAVYSNIHAGEPAKSATMNADSRDMMSALYALRKELPDIKLGTKATLPIVNLDRWFKMHVEVTGQEVMPTPFGERKVWKVEPSFEEHDGSIDSGRWAFWITADPMRLPVKIETKLNFGTFAATLVDVGDKRMVSRAPKELPVKGEIQLSDYVPQHLKQNPQD